MKNRILVAILLPVVTVGIILALWATNFLVPPLLSFIQKRTDASLQVVTNLGFEKCETSFNYLLDLRLENDESMIEALKRETLSQIKALGIRFDTIHLMVIDAQGEIMGGTAHFSTSSGLTAGTLNITGTIFDRKISGRPVRCVARYFPIWRWYVVGYIFEEEYLAPISMARKIIFGGTGIVLLAVIVTAGIAFHFRVYQPLQRIIRAAEKTAGGHLQKVTRVGRDEIGRVTATFNTMLDSLATDKLQINRILSELRQSEELYRVITENSLSLITLVQKGRIMFANRRTLEVLGYSAEELVGRPAMMHLHSDDHKMVLRMARLHILGRPSGGPVECRYYTKKADMRWMELAVVGTSYKGKSVLLAHGIDVTQRKQAYEEQQRLGSKLRQAQKMEAIGTLAGGIAHDFNNLLMGVQGNVSLLKMGMPTGAQMHERLRNIEQYIKNGAELTRQLLGYARGGKYQVKPIRIGDLVTQSAHMFGRTKKEIVIHYDLDPEGWPVEVDRGQIEQVLLNLYVNAWQAMPGGGDLFIATKNAFLSGGELKTFPDKEGYYVLITVTDTGIGMDEQVLQKIFDPFFTTKQRERGTGLGLASAYGIVKNHDGAIFCESKVGQGTTFSIYLPKTDKLPAEELNIDEKIKVGSETVLIVDDEQMVLEVGQELLEHLGYKVFTAKSGRIAVDIFKNNSQEIDMVLLDMVMPEMGGTETFELLRKIRPDIPVLLCSGYSLSGPASELMARGCNGFIQKPFDLDALSNHMRRILDKQKKRVGVRN